MQSTTILRAALPVLACAAVFGATEVWNIKDSSIWTDAEANSILNKSPWAKQVKAQAGQGGQAQRGGRGMGRRGGMGYPGGGGGYPGGGRGGQTNAQPMNVVVRWESAKPVREAEARLQKLNASSSDSENKPAVTSFENHYVISVIGLRAGSGGRNQSDDGGSAGQARDQLLTYTQLVLKNKAPLSPDDIKVKNRDGANEIQFFFAKTSPITMDDKEVTFRTTINRLKVEDKFDLKKMTRNKKLELD